MTCCPTLSSDGDGVGGSGQAQGAAMSAVTIHLRGEDRTAQIHDWKIYWSDKHQAWFLTCYFHSTKSFSLPLAECRISPTRELGGALLNKGKGGAAKRVEQATLYGNKYVIVSYAGNRKGYLHRLDDVSVVAETKLKQTPVFRYFLAVAQARGGQGGEASPDQDRIADNVVRQLNKLPAHPDSALRAYCSGANRSRELSRPLIFPFGVNASQIEAVEQAFRAQISVIEGPPGTGKTQTILNIVANILLRDETVAILSNNNSAVDNVVEKLQKSDLDYLVAKLGSKAKRSAFFESPPAVPSEPPLPAPALEEIDAAVIRLKQYLHAHNRAAQLKAEIQELQVEQRYLQQWHDENDVPVGLALERYRLTPARAADLMAYLSHLGQRPIGLRERFSLLLRFGVLRAAPFAAGAQRVRSFHALQAHFYQRQLQEKENELAACLATLKEGSFDASLEQVRQDSMLCLKQHLHGRQPDARAFGIDTYQADFGDFLARYPVIASSTHSIINSLAEGAMLDYVIIDEASQQDILPGVLGLGCARNLIVVGDRRQLPHIPVALGMPAPSPAYDCERLSLLDSVMAVFGDALPRTLLKEHYRCHPRIIQFCNQQFYDNALIPMTPDDGTEPLRLIVTAKGNHMRTTTNLREIESLLAVLDEAGERSGVDAQGRGFIAPFRAQVKLAGAQLPSDFVSDTVHKFQGRECEEMVFSTVLDKKRSSQSMSGFVDAAQMVNVAVSRAKRRFTLVTGDEVFAQRNGPVAALIRYIEYYADQAQVRRAPVVSAFDLLYQEYDRSLARLAASLRSGDSHFRSEQIVTQLLRELLASTRFAGLRFHCQVRLQQLASARNPAMTPRELEFMAQQASCDFVIYFKVGKQPLGVIEVDGGLHHGQQQSERDALKNSILHKSGIDLLRLQTIDSDIEARLGRFLAQWVDAGETTPPPAVPVALH